MSKRNKIATAILASLMFSLVASYLTLGILVRLRTLQYFDFLEFMLKSYTRILLP